jgi:hypothetical protein
MSYADPIYSVHSPAMSKLLVPARFLSRTQVLTRTYSSQLGGAIL